MTAHIFEESTLTLSAWIARGKGDRASAKFEFEQEGGSETVEAAELELGGKDGESKKVSTTITVPKCKDDEDSYTLSYKVTCGGVEYPGKDFKVWLKTAKFKAVDAEGNALPKVPFTFNQTGDKVYWTDSKGECPLPINATAAATVTVRSPCEIDEWKTEPGRIKEAQVTKHEYKVLIGGPDASATEEDSPYKQYVNLAARPNEPTRGSRLKVSIGGIKDEECIEGTPGDKVYIKVEFHTDNSKRNTPAPAIHVGGSEIKPNDKGIAEAETEFDDKGAANFEMELGLAGGDRAKIMAGITKACEDTTLYVQNWRRIWYQLTVPEGEDEPDLSQSADALGKVFIEYLKEGETKTIPKGSGPEGICSWVDGSYFADRYGTSPGDLVSNIGKHNREHFHGLFEPVHTPLHVHVLCSRVVFDARNNSNRRKQYLNMPVKLDTKVAWSDGSQVVGLRKGVDAGFYPTKLYDGSHPLMAGRWKASDNSAQGDIAEGDTFIKNHRITVKLPDDALEYLNGVGEGEAPRAVKVSIRVWTAGGPLNGNSQGHLQLLRIGRDDKGICQTLCHELGHSLRQVANTSSRKSPGLTGLTHGREYTGNGHNGAHCAEGMSADNYDGGSGKSGTGYQGNFRGKSECKCVMYGEGSSTRENDFCDRCKPFIVAEAAQSVVR